MTLDEQKKEFIVQIGKDRKIARSILLPQIIFISFIALSLAAIACYGLYQAILAFREKREAEVLTQAATAFVGGGSTLFGFVTLKLLTLVGRLCNEFVSGERRFTAFAARASSAVAVADYAAVLLDYDKW